MIKVCVIIPVFGRDAVFANITAARKSAVDGVELHFIVVDNGNGSPLREKLSALAADDVTVIRLERNLGGSGAYAAGMTAAMAAECQYLWLLDDDAEPDPHTLNELLKTVAAKGDDVGAAASTLLSLADPERIIESVASVRGLYGKLCARYEGRNIREVPAGDSECEYSAAASILIPAAVVRNVGVFAQTFIHYDDVEWCFRARRMGYRIYISTRSVVHHPDWSANFSTWLCYYNTRNKLWFLKRYRPRQWFFSEILLRVKAVFFACRGRRRAAELMFLGMKHAASGELLMRDEVERIIR